MTTLPPPLELGPMPVGRPMTTVDEQVVRAPLEHIFRLAAEVERWPALLPHYRYVRFVERRSDGGGIVEMSASRPFGVVRWPTWGKSRMFTQMHSACVTPAVSIRANTPSMSEASSGKFRWQCESTSTSLKYCAS